jgi:hypothetical protein
LPPGHSLWSGRTAWALGVTRRSFRALGMAAAPASARCA